MHITNAFWKQIHWTFAHRTGPARVEPKGVCSPDQFSWISEFVRRARARCLLVLAFPHVGTTRPFSRHSLSGCNGSGPVLTSPSQPPLKGNAVSSSVLLIRQGGTEGRSHSSESRGWFWGRRVRAHICLQLPRGAPHREHLSSRD